MLVGNAAAKFATPPNQPSEAAENIENAVCDLETDVQAIRRACKHMDDGALVEQGAGVIRARMSKEFPHLHDDIAGYVAFAQRLGGSNSMYLQLFFQLHEAKVPHGRQLRGPFLRALSEWPLEAPLMKVAVALAATLCPRASVERLWCGWISAADLNARKKDARRINFPCRIRVCCHVILFCFFCRFILHPLAPSSDFACVLSNC